MVATYNNCSLCWVQLLAKNSQQNPYSVGAGAFYLSLRPLKSETTQQQRVRCTRGVSEGWCFRCVGVRADRLISGHSPNSLTESSPKPDAASGTILSCMQKRIDSLVYTHVQTTRTTVCCRVMVRFGAFRRVFVLAAILLLPVASSGG